ncbi:MAG: DUF721 domain-containing protein [Phycisphaerae bacterium]|nr:DUF721 domain-containing protein [Phycisphaerae bacterium]
MPAAPESPVRNADTIVKLERLRNFRGRRERDTAIAPIVNAFERELSRQERSIGSAGRAWESLVPAELAARSRVVSNSRGTLLVSVDDPATSFELDRALRGGVEAALRAALRAGSLRVRLRVGA